MKKRLLFLMVLVCACLAGRAGLVCEQPVFDFGSASSRETVSHVFELRNAGTSRVTITKVRKTCGCTEARVTKKSLDPEETTAVRVAVSLKGRSGLQRKAVYVYTDVSETPLRLLMKGQVARAKKGPARPAESTVAHRPVFSGDGATGLRAVPRTIRISSDAPIGLTVYVAIHGEQGGAVEIEAILPPADVAYSVQSVGGKQIVKLGPIPNPFALAGTELVVVTPAGRLVIPCRVEEY